MSGSLSVGTIYATVELRTAKYAQDIKKAEGMTASFSRSLSTGMLAAGAAATAGLGAIIRKSSEFENSMRNVNSVLKLSEAGYQGLRREVQALAKDPSITQGPADLARGLYDVTGSGFQGAQALDILRVSAMGATAGLTETSTSSKVLTAVLNSHIRGVGSAREGMDQLFQVVNLGVGTFGDLAGSLGNVIGTAAKAGVSLQEVGAFMALASRQGQTFSDASQDLLNLISKIVKPGEDSVKVFKALGIEYGIGALQAKGLSGVVSDIIAKTKGNQQVLSQLLPDLQAYRGLLVAMTNGGKDYTDMLGQMNTASSGVGATQSALAEQLKAPGAQFALLRKEAELLAVELGDTLAPAVKNVIATGRSLVKWFADLPPAVQENLVQLGAFTAALGLLGGLIPKVVASLAALRAGMALLTTPAGLVITAVGLLAGGLYLLVQREKEAANQAVKHASARQQQAQRAYDESKALSALTAEYVRLSGKQNKNAEDTKKLAALREQIVRLNPSLATQFDADGKALGLYGDVLARVKRLEKERFDQLKVQTLETARLQKAAIEGEIARQEQLHATYMNVLNKGYFSNQSEISANTMKGMTAEQQAAFRRKFIRPDLANPTPEQQRYAKGRVNSLNETLSALRRDKQKVDAIIRGGGIPPMPVAAPKPGSKKVGAGGYDPDADKTAADKEKANAQARIALLETVGKHRDAAIAKAKLQYKEDLKDGVEKATAEQLLNARILEANTQHAEKLAAIEKQKNDDLAQYWTERKNTLTQIAEAEQKAVQESGKRLNEAYAQAGREGQPDLVTEMGGPFASDPEALEQARQERIDAQQAWATQYVGAYEGFARAIVSVIAKAQADEAAAILKFTDEMDAFKAKAGQDAAEGRKEKLRKSIGVQFGYDLGYELASEVGRGMENMFGSNIFGRAISRALTRQVDTWADQLITGLVNSIAKGKGKGGLGGGLNIAQGKTDFGSMLLSTLVGVGVGSLAGAIFKPVGDLFGGIFGGKKKRAAGGPVWPHSAFLVGERGPEMFVPQSAGMIVPNGGSRMLPGGGVLGSDGATIHYHGPLIGQAHISSDMDIERVATELGRRWNDMQRTRYGSGRQ
jgi:TP901 family phage tail tape measure protein